MTNDNVFEAVRAFVIQKTLYCTTDINEITELQKDLGIYGDDATEFLLSFGEEFNVDLSGFPADKYFKSEGGELPLLHFFMKLFKINTETHLPITIGDLVEAVRIGKLK